MDRLDKLTPEQEAMLPRIRDEWIGHGLNTDPANRPEAEDGVRQAYISGGLEPPKKIIWFDSPLAGAVAQGMLVSGEVDDIDPETFTIPANPSKYLKSWSSNCIGYLELGWIAYFKALAAFGIDTSAIDGVAKVQMNAGWWFPLDEVAIVTERPQHIKQDKEGRLHADDGPAVLYRDGFAVYSWHGTRVPKGLIDGWTVEQIFAERNTEIRRCAIEKMGWPELLEQSGMEIVASAPDPGNEPFFLSLYDLPKGAEDIFEVDARILVCTNGSVERDGTRHQFGLVVPGHHVDPVAAAAELYDVSVEEYAELQVRR